MLSNGLLLLLLLLVVVVLVVVLVVVMVVETQGPLSLRNHGWVGQHTHKHLHKQLVMESSGAESGRPVDVLFVLPWRKRVSF